MQTSSHELKVDLGDRSYPIYIGEALLGEPDYFSQHIPGKQVMVVTNETVGPLYLDKLGAALRGFDVQSLVLPDGEQYKTQEIVGRIYDALLENRFDRGCTLIALGGGVVGDMTGFAAATYQRGVNFIQVPTTLLAQVDSSVGGKTGVNHPLGKNMIGAFYQPLCVLADTGTLESLPARELSAGLAEVIKYGLINDPEFFSWLEQNMERLMARDGGALAYAIERSCADKAAIVAADERESGQRALLNLGHTFGHAIETGMGYGTWLHGEAVGAGLCMAARLSQRLGRMSGEEVDRTIALVKSAGLPTEPPEELDHETLFANMSVDKKVVGGELRLVLLNGIGHAEVTSEFNKQQLMVELGGEDLLPGVQQSAGGYIETPALKTFFGKLYEYLGRDKRMHYISGPSGSGKTMFADRLAALLSSKYKVLKLAVNPMVEIQSLVRTELDLPESEQWPPVELLDSGDGENQLVLIVDDADLLSKQDVRAVWALQKAGHAVIFIGKGGFSGGLKLKNLPERELPLFEGHECRDYLVAQGVSPQSEAAIDELISRSGGCPGKLNELSLLMAWNEKDPEDNEDEFDLEESEGIGKVGMILTVLLLVVAGASWLAIKNQWIVVPWGAAESPMDSPSLQTGQPKAPVWGSIEGPGADSNGETGAEIVAVTGRSSAEDGSQDGIDSETSNLMTRPTGSSDTLSASIDTGDNQEDEPYNAREANAADIDAEAEPAEAFTSEQVEVSDNDWLMSQEPENLTIQIIGAWDKSVLNEIVDRVKPSEKTAIYERSRGGKPWYSLVVGVYPDSNSAIEAKRVLEPEFRVKDAMVRKFSYIQRAIGN